VSAGKAIATYFLGFFGMRAKAGVEFLGRRK